MTKSPLRFFLFAVTSLLFLGLAINFCKFPGSKEQPNEKTSVVREHTQGPSIQVAGTAIAESSLISPTDRYPKAPVKLEQEAFVVKRMDQAKWERIRQEKNLSIKPNRTFIFDPFPVELNLAPLEAAREKAVTRIRFDLGLEKPTIAEVGHRFEHGPEAYSIGGKLEGDPGSEYSVSVYKDAVVGTFRSDRFGIRQLRYVGEGIHRIESIRDEIAPRCATPLLAGGDHVMEAKAEQAGPKIAKAGSGKSGGAEGDPIYTLDVLIAYTSSAVSSEGGLNPLLALINQGIADTNVAFQTNNIDGNLRLVGTLEVAYSGTSSSSSLTALRSSNDGIMDEVHNARDSSGADFVSLWTGLSGSCGRAYVINFLNTNQSPYAFSVVDPACQYKYTFTHELGHNLGCKHAVGDSSSSRGGGMYNYSHGWRWVGSNGTQYRSIMAYSPGSRLRMYSDPTIAYQGVAAGRVNLEDNARSIRQVLPVMSAFRATNSDDHGNTISSASTITTSSSTPGTLEEVDDLDMFRFVLSAPADMTFATSGNTDTRGRLLNSSGTQLSINSNGGSGNNFSFSASLTTGTYFIEVSGESDSTGIYTLQVSGGNGDDHGNNLNSATSLPVPGTIAGSLEMGGDEDFFRLNVPVPGTLTVFTSGYTDTYGYLLDEGGNILESDDDDGVGADFSISRSVNAGVHYVRVRGSLASTTGSYTLNASLTEVPDDHANTFTEATIIPAGSMTQPSLTDGFFETVGDVDMLRFTLYGTAPDTEQDPLTLTFDVSGPPPGGEATIISREENDFTVAGATGTDLWFVGAAYQSGGTYLADNGTPHFKILPGDVLELTRADETAFSANFVDLGEWSQSNHPAKSITWIGHKSDGSTVNHTFVTDGVMDGPGGAVDFETFQFPASFQNIVKLETNSTVFALDNIVVEDSTTIQLDIEGAPTVPTGIQLEANSYSEDGFSMMPVAGRTMFRTNSGAPAFPDNGGTYLHLGAGDTFELVSDGGTLFDILQLEMSEYSTSYQTPQSITWKGYRPDGGVVTHTFQTDGIMDGSGGSSDFQTFSFPASFMGLTKLESDSSPVAVDNLTVKFSDDPIPAGNLQVYSTGNTDTVAEIYNSSLELLASNDDGGSGSNFLISQADFPVGTYFLRINESSDNATGGYTIHLGYGLEVGPPHAPLNFTASQDNNSTVLLAWDIPATAVSSTTYRNTVDDFGSATVLAGTIYGSSFNDPSGTPGAQYYYWVTSSNSGGESPPSSSAIGGIRVPGPDVTSQPSDIVVPEGESANLSVSATTTAGTLAYQWYRGEAGDISIAVGSNSSSLTVDNVTATDSYWVRVDNGFNHTDSASAFVSVKLVPSTKVTGAEGLSDTTILIRWYSVPDAISYAVYRNTLDDAGTATKIGTSVETSFEDSTASQGQSYFYFIRAVNDAGAEGLFSGGNAHRGSLSDAPFDGTVLPLGGVSDFAYTADGSHLILAGDSGWLDRYSVTEKVINSWVGIGDSLLGVDVNVTGTTALATAAVGSEGNAVAYEVNFSGNQPLVVKRQNPLQGGETGFYDVQFVSNETVFLSSQTGDPSAPLRELNLGAGIFFDRGDINTGNGEVGNKTFFASVSGGLQVSSLQDGDILYSNDFESGDSLSDFTVGEFGGAGVTLENGKLRLDPGTGANDRAFVSLRLADFVPEFDPVLALNTGKLSWSFNLSNHPGEFNPFYFHLHNKADPDGGTRLGYQLRGGLSDDRMIFYRTPLASLIDRPDGLVAGNEGSFRITYEPAAREWNVYFRQGPYPLDPLSINTLYGTVPNPVYTSSHTTTTLPWVIFYTSSSGHVLVDNFSFSIESGNSLDSDARSERLTIVQSEIPEAGWFDYTLSEDSFGTEMSHSANVEYAAVSPHGDFVAMADGIGTTIYDPDGAVVTTLPFSGGVGFSPQTYQLYLADPTSDQVRVFSTFDWREITTLPIPGGLASNAGPFGQGNLKVRPDGLEIALLCEDGIRFFDLTPLVAGPTLEVTEFSPDILIGDASESNAGLSSTFTITNPDTSPMDWQIEGNSDWLDLSAVSGTLAAGASVEVTGTLNAQIDSMYGDTFNSSFLVVAPEKGRSQPRELTTRVLDIGILPILEDFEEFESHLQELEDHWEDTGAGQAYRRSTNGALRGNYHWEMQSHFSGYFARNELTLTVDLRNASGVELRFRAKEFNDEQNFSPPVFKKGMDFDGVAISEDGETWYSVLIFPENFPTDTEFFVDLDAEVAARGLSYNRGFQIRFNHFCNDRVPFDGIALDNIELTTTADRAVTGTILVENSDTSVGIASGSTVEFGNVFVDTSYTFPITIRNNGPGLLTDISATENGHIDFAVEGIPIPRLFPGESTNLAIRLHPTTLGERDTSVSILSNDTGNSPYTFDTAGTAFHSLSSWRLQHFGTTSNSGDAADTADSNGDGIINHTAFALGLDPNKISVFPLFIDNVTDTTITATYIRSQSGVLAGITYTAEWCDDLSGNVWSSAGVTETVIDETAGIETVEVTVPCDGQNLRCLRLRVIP